jgi:2-oxo-3-(phosphooxy)propyl 3-oxoalkanoate synthase
MTMPPPPELLQQRSAEQIFVTDWGQGDEGFTFSAQLPLEHPRYSDTCTPFHDLLVIAETVSQVGMLSTITLLGVPSDSEFFMRRLSAALDPLQNNLRAPESTGLLLSTSDGAAGVKFRPDGSSSGAFLHTQNVLAGRPSGSSGVQAFWMPAKRYRDFRARMRRRSRVAEPADRSLEREALTGREKPENSVLASLEPVGKRRYATSVLVDTEDPTFYDRPLDHVSGFLLCEAAKQAAMAAACHEAGASPEEVVITAADFSFIAFAELDDLTRCEVELREDLGGAAVEFIQSDRVVSRADLTVVRL